MTDLHTAFLTGVSLSAAFRAGAFAFGKAGTFLSGCDLLVPGNLPSGRQPEKPSVMVFFANQNLNP